MGFWDLGISDIISAGSSAYSAYSSEKSVAAMNAANAAEAQKNRDWQERMSNTAHTREVADLRNAGLNPILSATGGSGASSPGGSMATMEDIGVRSAGIKSQMAYLAAQTAATSAVGAKSTAEASTARAESKLANAGLKDKMAAQVSSAKAAANKAKIDEKMSVADAIAQRAASALDVVRSFLPFTSGSRSTTKKE
ncbi:MAG: DNA pilot protein [Arizlama microvirus]|nr:MAG: DNA pilot protein [Arizlama microvirus]